MELPGLNRELLKMTKEELILELIRERQAHQALKEEAEKCRKQIVMFTFRQITAEAERDALKTELEKAQQALLQAQPRYVNYLSFSAIYKLTDGSHILSNQAQKKTGSKRCNCYKRHYEA